MRCPLDAVCFSIVGMHALAGPYAAVCVLLVVGGAFKAMDPAPTVGALRALKLPSRKGLVQFLGALEVGVGATALAFDSRVAAALVVASYAAFTGFVVVALRRGEMIGSCGCFGRADTPPTVTHLAINAGATAVAAATAALRSPTSFVSEWTDQPLFGIPFTLLCLTCAGLGYLALTRLPQLDQLRNRR